MGDDKGEKFLQNMAHLFSQNGICTAFTARTPTHSAFLDISDLIEVFQDLAEFLSKTDVNIFVINAETRTMMSVQWLLFLFELYDMKRLHKVWVMTAHWDFSSEIFHRTLNLQAFHGTLSFAIHSNQVQGFQTFLHELKPDSDGDSFRRIFWEQAFNCLFQDTDVSMETGVHCTGEEKLEGLPGPLFEMTMTGQSYSIYNAGHAIAHALHELYSSRAKHRFVADGSKQELQNFKVMNVSRGKLIY